MFDGIDAGEVENSCNKGQSKKNTEGIVPHGWKIFSSMDDPKQQGRY